MTQERNPLTARSVVASLLLGTEPPRLPAAALVGAAAALGCAEGTTRVALSRMVAAGELVATAGWYELAGSLVARRRRQDEGRRPALRRWDGTWLLAVVGGQGPRTAAERSAMRRQLVEARLAEWREGVWTRPDNLAVPRRDIPGCVWVTGAKLDQAPALWDVDAWASRARDLLGALELDAGLRPAFESAAAVVRHLRDDPLLPDALLPSPWPGEELRAAYDRFERQLRAALRPVLTGR
jgi:phenylacetic acid degradation operon negative regulatory protein